jgi:hypothetical protein
VETGDAWNTILRNAGNNPHIAWPAGADPASQLDRLRGEIDRVQDAILHHMETREAWETILRNATNEARLIWVAEAGAAADIAAPLVEAPLPVQNSISEPVHREEAVVAQQQIAQQEEVHVPVESVQLPELVHALEETTDPVAEISHAMQQAVAEPEVVELVAAKAPVAVASSPVPVESVQARCEDDSPTVGAQARQEAVQPAQTSVQAQELEATVVTAPEKVIETSPDGLHVWDFVGIKKQFGDFAKSVVSPEFWKTGNAEEPNSEEKFQSLGLS